MGAVPTLVAGGTHGRTGVRQADGTTVDGADRGGRHRADRPRRRGHLPRTRGAATTSAATGTSTTSTTDALRHRELAERAECRQRDEPDRIERIVTVAKRTLPLWGTTAEVLVTDPRALDGACGLALRRLAAVSDACDRFRADSELSRIRDRASAGVEVSPSSPGSSGWRWRRRGSRVAPSIRRSAAPSGTPVRTAPSASCTTAADPCERSHGPGRHGSGCTWTAPGSRCRTAWSSTSAPSRRRPRRTRSPRPSPTASAAARW